MKVLIVVDVQNDFCEGGSLAVAGGAAVVEAIHLFIRQNRHRYDLVVTSQDWHAADHSNGGHFASPGETPDYAQTWPGHCVEGEHGSDFHANFHPALPFVDVQVRKGMGEPAYSAFEGRTVEHGHDLTTTLHMEAAHLSGDVPAPQIDIDVAGIATDFCVAATALDAVAVPNVGEVRILEHLTAAVDPNAWATTGIVQVQRAGVLVV